MSLHIPNLGGLAGTVSYGLGENKTAAQCSGFQCRLQREYMGWSLVYWLWATRSEDLTYGNVTTSSDFIRFDGSYDFGVATAKLTYGQP